MANDLHFVKHVYQDGDILTATNMNRIEGLFEDIYEVLNATPVIVGQKERYLVRGNSLTLIFDVENARGNIRYSITYQGAVVASGNSSGRHFEIGLGTRYQLGVNTYRLVLEDGMNNVVEDYFKVTVLNMEFGFEDVNYPNFAIDLNETITTQDITYDGQRIAFNAGSEYGDNVNIQVFYSYKNSKDLELPASTMQIENGVYYWPFPVIKYALEGTQDDIFDIQFYLQLTIFGTEETYTIPTDPIVSTCYCLYGDNYKIAPLAGQLNDFVDYQRAIVRAQLIAQMGVQLYSS